MESFVQQVRNYRHLKFSTYNVKLISKFEVEFLDVDSLLGASMRQTTWSNELKFCICLIKTIRSCLEEKYMQIAIKKVLKKDFENKDIKGSFI